MSPLDGKTVPEEIDAIQVGIGDFAVTDSGTLLESYGLGSCVAIAVVDSDSDVGGLAHIMLPHANDLDTETSAKFADTATRQMVEELGSFGVSRTGLEAKIAGGSEMFEFSGIGKEVGKRNVAAVKAALDDIGVEITGSDVGGDHGRSVSFDPSAGTLTVTTANGGSKEI